MLSVSEALEKILSVFNPLKTEIVALEEAVGRVLAEPISATLNLPPFTNSSMDGYAVRAVDVQAASATTSIILTIIGDIPAGVLPTLAIEPGTAARIMTGAYLPTGADAVVPVESTGLTRGGMEAALPSTISVNESVAVGAYIRQLGEDVRQGEAVIPAGHLVRAYDLNLLAAFGLTNVPVIRRPRVAILSTGDELVEIGSKPGPGQIRDSNSFALAGLVRKYGGLPARLGVAADRVEAVTAKLQEAVDSGADLILSSAGVSVGAYDVVKAAIEQAGSLDFWKVRMRPGKPLAFGQYQGIPYFGLPGNPVSTVVTFELFVRPTLLRLGGHRRLDKPKLRVELVDTVQSDGRESYLRAVVMKSDGRYLARSAGGQGSNILSALVQANALVIVPEGVTEIKGGASIEAWMLDWPEEVIW
jgi:molybdopterin molybdotransferase